MVLYNLLLNRDIVLALMKKLIVVWICLLLVAGGAFAWYATNNSNDKVATKLIEKLSVRDAKVSGIYRKPDCEIPTGYILKNIGNGEFFRVICRVYYIKDSTKRWRDMTCIGNFGLHPMLDHCYQWVPYQDPAFAPFKPH